MSARSFQRLRVTVPVPEDEDRSRPALPAGAIVWSFDGPTDIPTVYGPRPGLRASERAVTLAQWTPDDPYQPWYPVPADAVKETPASGSASPFTEGNHS